MDKRDPFLEALTRILDYLEEDEEKDYLSHPPEEVRDHIYFDICFLRGWISSARQRHIQGSRRKQ